MTPRFTAVQWRQTIAKLAHLSSHVHVGTGSHVVPYKVMAEKGREIRDLLGKISKHVYYEF